jgi:hypothetical protein
VDTLNLAETVSAADTVRISAVVATSAESNSVTVTGNDNNKGEDTVSSFALGTDVIQIVTTAGVSFVHGTDTQIGLANAGVAATGIAGDYAISAGLIDLDNDGFYNGVDDVVVNFSGPSATLTEALFEAALQYNITLSNVAGVVTTGGLADTITGGTAGDSITAGEGLDRIAVGAAGNLDRVTIGGTQTSVDIVTGFVSTEDKIQSTIALLNAADATITDAGDLSAKATVNAAIAVSATATQYVFDNAAFEIDLATATDGDGATATELAAIVTAARTALNATAMTNIDATFLVSETVLFVLDDTADDATAIFSFKNTTAAANTINAGELVLIGIVDADTPLVNADIIL